jgi:hypothetical protein
MNNNELYCLHRKGKVPKNSCFECFHDKKTADPRALGFPQCKRINLIHHDILSALHQRYKKDERFNIMTNHLNSFLLENDIPIEDMESAILLIRLNYLK